MDATCKTCPAFDPDSASGLDGLCRSTPPKPVIEPETDAAYACITHVWAEVQFTDWCSLHPERRMLMNWSSATDIIDQLRAELKL